MKNNLTLVLALAVVSSPAFASTARLQALGEDANGSYYIHDSRNMFLNPAEISHYKKKLMIETASKEGAFINTFGDYTYSVALNHIESTAPYVVTGTTNLGVVTGTYGAANALELGFAGEGMVNWGLSVAHGGANNGGTNTESYWLARLGAGKDAWMVHATVGLYGDAKDTNATYANGLGGTTTGTTETKSKFALAVGASYAIDSNLNAFGKFATGNSDVIVGTTVNHKDTNYGVGVGYKKEMTKSTTLFTRLEADKDTTTVGSTPDVSNWNVPLTFAAESQALSWLAVRASIAHNLLQQTNAGGTVVAAGLGMTFGDVNIDALVADGTAPTTNGALGTGGASGGSTFGFGQSMLANVALTYNF